MRRMWVWLWLLGALFMGCGRGPETSPETMTLALNWFPEPEHGGYYAALLNGHFAAEGLDVKILPGGPSAPVVERLVRGQVQAGLSNADQILLKRNQGADVVALLAPLQQTPRCILVHQETGIEDFQSLANVKLAASPGRPFLEYMQHKLPLDNVQMVPYSGRLSSFLLDKQYAQQGYVFSEPILARREGAAVNVLKLSDLGFNPYASVLVMDRSWLEQHPQQAEKFVRACQRGWEDYLRDPQAVHEELLRLNSELDAEMLSEAHQVLQPLCEPPAGEPLGSMQAERWSQLKQQLVEIGQIDASLDEQRAFENRFLIAGAETESSAARASSPGEASGD